MLESIIIEKEKARMRSPILIEGLPGIGMVGKLAADHIVKELKGTMVAQLYSPHFPHQVLMQKNGLMKMLKYKFYLIRGKKNDLLVLVGDVQAMTSEAQYEVAGKVLDYAQRKGCKLIFTLGGYGIGKTIGGSRVFGSATDKELIPLYSKHGVIFGESRGSIIGAAGLLLGMGRIRGMKGVCLMGETHGAYVDAKAAEEVLKVLSKILGIKINLEKLSERARDGERFMKKMEKEAEKQREALTKTKGETLSYIR